ncbi:MAG: hypothetical protein WCX65_07390 [bacterium]
MRVYFYVLISALLGLDPFAPIERSLEKQLRDKIAGLESAAVKISATRLGFLFLGICRSVTVEMSGLPTGAIRIDSFKITAGKFRFSPFSTFVLNKPIVRGGGDTRWTIRLLAVDIQEYITSRGPFLRGVVVRIEPESVTLKRSSSIAAALSLKEPFSVSGCLALDAKNNVALDLEHLHSFGVGPGRPLLKTILRLVNPILTAADINRLLSKTQGGPLDSVKLTAAFEEICMDHGHIDLQGSIAAEPAPKKEPAPKADPAAKPKNATKPKKEAISKKVKSQNKEKKQKKETKLKKETKPKNERQKGFPKRRMRNSFHKPPHNIE